MSAFIPNSFQTPNAYIDRVMHLLTPEEFKVLIYAVRRILGFQKRRDRISLSQFVSGVSSGGSQKDHGTGLNRETVIRCLESLVAFGLLTRKDEPRHPDGTLYILQLDSDAVDLAGLQKRQQEKAT